MMHKRVHFSEGNEDKKMFELINELNNNSTNTDLRRCALRAIRNVIENDLTSRQKEVIMLYYYEKHKMPEIAQMLDVNISTVSRTIKRARTRMFSVLRYYFNQ